MYVWFKSVNFTSFGRQEGAFLEFELGLDYSGEILIVNIFTCLYFKHV